MREIVVESCVCTFKKNLCEVFCRTHFVYIFCWFAVIIKAFWLLFHWYDFVIIYSCIQLGEVIQHRFSVCKTPQAVFNESDCHLIPFSCAISALFLSHSEHRFSATSSKLCQNWLRHWRGTLYLRAAVHRCCQHPPKYTNISVEASWSPSTHVNMRRVRPG